MRGFWSKRRIVSAAVLGAVAAAVGMISVGTAEGATPRMFDQVKVLTNISGSALVVNMNLDEDCIAVSTGAWSQGAARVPAGAGEDVAVNLFPGSSNCQGAFTKIVRQVPENPEQDIDLWLDVR